MHILAGSILGLERYTSTFYCYNADHTTIERKRNKVALRGCGVNFGDEENGGSNGRLDKQIMSALNFICLGGTPSKSLSEPYYVLMLDIGIRIHIYRSGCSSADALSY